MNIIDKARKAHPIGKQVQNDVWGPHMPIMRVLVEERGFSAIGAARWLESEGAIKLGQAKLVALSFRQRSMRQRRRIRNGGQRS